MPAADRSPPSPAARPPHPATRPRGTAVQPKAAGPAAGPHPATVARGTAVQPKAARPAAGPHPATLPRESADAGARTSAQPKTPRKTRGPHPATVPRGAAVQPKRAGAGAAPHPATVPREAASSAIQPSTRKAKYYKKGSKGGVEVYLNGGKKPIAATNQSKASGHAERVAVGQAPGGNITLEQNAWPCSECHTWLAQQSTSRGVTITVTVTGDQGSYSLDHRGDGVAQGDTGTIVYANGGATTTVD